MEKVETKKNSITISTHERNALSAAQSMWTNETVPVQINIEKWK